MTHRLARIHELHDGPIKGLDATDDRTVTGGADGVVRLLSASGEHQASTRPHDDIVNSVSLEPGGLVASGSRDRTVRLFDPGKGRTYVVGEHEHWVMSVTWSPDGRRIASGSEDGTLGIWDPEGSSVSRVRLGRPVNAVDWAGATIAAVTGDGVLHLLDEGGDVRRRDDGARQIPWSVALSPDGGTVAWTGRDRRLRIAPVAGGEPVVVPAHGAQVWSVAWDRSGARIVTCGADGTAAVWAPDGTAIERVSTPSWLRRALLRRSELLLATEDGDLRVHADDGMPARAPEPIALPKPPESCEHWDPRVESAGPRPRCEECGSAEEARLCVTCGHVGCCESQLAHGTKHWLATGHPNTVPAATGPFRWRWCYEDDMYVK